MSCSREMSVILYENIAYKLTYNFRVQTKEMTHSELEIRKLSLTKYNSVYKSTAKFWEDH